MITFAPETKNDALLRKWVGQHFSAGQEVTVGYASFAEIRTKIGDGARKNYELRDKRLILVDRSVAFVVTILAQERGEKEEGHDDGS